MISFLLSVFFYYNNEFVVSFGLNSFQKCTLYFNQRIVTQAIFSNIGLFKFIFFADFFLILFAICPDLCIRYNRYNKNNFEDGKFSIDFFHTLCQYLPIDVKLIRSPFQVGETDQSCITFNELEFKINFHFFFQTKITIPTIKVKLQIW